MRTIEMPFQTDEPDFDNAYWPSASGTKVRAPNHKSREVKCKQDYIIGSLLSVCF